MRKLKRNVEEMSETSDEVDALVQKMRGTNLSNQEVQKEIRNARESSRVKQRRSESPTKVQWQDETLRSRLTDNFSKVFEETVAEQHFLRAHQQSK